MTPHHPFTWWSLKAQQRAFIVLFITAILWAFLMIDVGTPLDDSGASIIDFELAGDLRSSQDIVDTWEEKEIKIYAALSLGLDYLFLVLYGAATALGCTLIAGKLGGRIKVLATIGIWLAWAALLAALLDAIENAALVQLLFGSQSTFLPVIAKWTAYVKFGLILPGLAYAALVGLPVLLWSIWQRVRSN